MDVLQVIVAQPPLHPYQSCLPTVDGASKTYVHKKDNSISLMPLEKCSQFDMRQNALKINQETLDYMARINHLVNL